jgi:hypothetical protein
MSNEAGTGADSGGRGLKRKRDSLLLILNS